MQKRFSSKTIAGCFLALLLLGCDASKDCVYTARLFHPDDSGGCLDAYAPIGLVEADELDSTCVPVCLAIDGALYVSTVCPPYPTAAELVEPSASADCERALALSMNEDSVCK